MIGQPEQACVNLDDEIERLRGEGWRLDIIYPADDPHSAVLSRAAEQVRITSRPGSNGPSSLLPPFEPAALLRRAGDDSGASGRAGMFYRDLIPGRLGGRYIASHIRIEEAGPVADWVHYHRVAVQLICVIQGWVKLIYEGQGGAFVARAGDVVVQPPAIRHRVLESSADLSVVEIGCPALHETLAEHHIALPTAAEDRERLFGGQRFCHHIAASGRWTPCVGGEAQETAVNAATAGLADVRTIRSAGNPTLDFPAHDGELVFGFVAAGTAMLNGDRLQAEDAFVIPPRQQWSLAEVREDFRLLLVTTSTMPESLAPETA